MNYNPTDFDCGNSYEQSRAIAVSGVSEETGAIALVPTSILGLRQPVTFTKTGGDPNITISADGTISAAVAIDAGNTQTIFANLFGSDGTTVPSSISVTVSVAGIPAGVLTYAGNPLAYDTTLLTYGVPA